MLKSTRLLSKRLAKFVSLWWSRSDLDQLILAILNAHTFSPKPSPDSIPLPWKKGLAAVFNLRAACGRAVVRCAESCCLSHMLMNCSGLRHKLHTWQDDQIKTAQVRDGAVRQGPKRLQHLLSRYPFQVHASYAASVWQPAALGYTSVCLTRFFAFVYASHSHARSLTRILMHAWPALATRCLPAM